MTIHTTTRNANLQDLVQILQDQHARKVDVVAPASKISAVDGRLVVAGAEAILGEDGVTQADGTYVPTAVADEGIAGRLDIPVGYLKRLRAERPDLYDANVNGWLHGALASEGKTPDPRSFLIRAFRGDDGEDGIARAFLSDRYGFVDNLDVLMATLQGIRDAGVEVQVRSADLTDRRMVVRVECPAVTALAPRLLEGYRSPWNGQTGADNPLVSAGFRFTNSETGGGAYAIVPEVTVQICKNGMTLQKEALRKIHFGTQLNEGVVQWGQDTQEKSLQLVSMQTRDAVKTFLSEEYLNGAVERLSAEAGEEVGGIDEVKDVVKPLRFSDSQVDDILGFFVKGGQMTVGGVVNAITAYSQTVDDGDVAYDLETKATSLLGV